MEELLPKGTRVVNRRSYASGKVVETYVDTTDPNDVYLGATILLDNNGGTVDVRDASDWVVMPDVAKSIADAILNLNM